MIYGLVGFKGSGKDTVANYLESHGIGGSWTVLSFASSLKDAAASIFNWDRNALEGRSLQSREWRETTDEWWAKKLDIPNFSPRLGLQMLGTEVMRNNFHEKIWMYSLDRKIEDLDTDHAVITDMRFPNEIAMGREKGKIIYIERYTPNWYPMFWTLQEYIKTYGEKNSITQDFIQELKSRGAHESEWRWIPEVLPEWGGSHDIYLDNSRDYDYLYEQIDRKIEDDLSFRHFT